MFLNQSALHKVIRDPHFFLNVFFFLNDFLCIFKTMNRFDLLTLFDKTWKFKIRLEKCIT